MRKSVIIREHRQISFHQPESGVQRMIFPQLWFTHRKQGETVCKRGDDLRRLVGAAVIHNYKLPP
jgi:hypothetical protein